MEASSVKSTSWTGPRQVGEFHGKQLPVNKMIWHGHRIESMVSMRQVENIYIFLVSE